MIQPTASARRVVLLVPPGVPDQTPNREGSACMGSIVEAKGGFRYPPQTLALVAAVLRDRGYRVTVIDAVASDMDSDECLAAILRASADLIGLFVSWATREMDRACLADLKAAKRCAAPVFALGVSTRYMLADLDLADCVLLGEPELSFAALCDTYFAKGGFSARVVSPKDLALSGHDGQGRLLDLDRLPVPAWELLPTEAYPFLTILSSRGCASHCSWCPYTVSQGHLYRANSPKRTVDELADLVERHHPHRIVFRDPVFVHSAERVRALCLGILADERLKPGKNLFWECETRPDHLTPRLLRLMSLAGCVTIKLGLETVSTRVLVDQGRVADSGSAQAYLRRTRQVARQCSRLGISTRLYCLVGLPGQTDEDLGSTAKWLQETGPERVEIKQVHAYPGAMSEHAIRVAASETQAGLICLESVRDSLQRQSRMAPRWWQRLERALSRASIVLRLI